MAGRVIRLNELIAHTGLSRSAIYDRLDAKSPRHDPTFPRSFSPVELLLVGIFEEVDRWLWAVQNLVNDKLSSSRRRA